MKYVAKNLRNRPGAPQPKPKRKHYLDHLVVTRVAGADRSAGRILAGRQVIFCALGGGGVKRDKREGDHATPAGSWRLLSGLYRPERRLSRPRLLSMRPINGNLGWCDEPDSPLYNRLIVKPFRHSHENLLRADRLYDVVIVVDYNISPRRKRRGSAIFIHCAREQSAFGRKFAPTEGCVALRYDDLRKLLPRLSDRTVLTVK